MPKGVRASSGALNSARAEPYPKKSAKGNSSKDKENVDEQMVTSVNG